MTAPINTKITNKPYIIACATSTLTVSVKVLIALSRIYMVLVHMDTAPSQREVKKFTTPVLPTNTLA